jgi:hypothetical protein
MRRRRRMLLAAGVLMVLGSSLSLDPAQASSATAIDDSGWWWAVQTNPDVTLPGPPTVAAGQLHVEGAPTGATAIAAIAATLADGEAKPILTLAVAAGGDAGGDGAILLACQAGSAWAGGDAQAWPTKPQPACSPGGVQGTRADDGTSWTFDLTALQFNNKVNVVLVPGTVEGQPEGTNGSAFSLTFEPPTADSLQTSAGEPPAPPTTTPLDPGVAPPAGGGGASFDSPSFDSGGVELPPVEAALPEDEQGLTPVAPSVQDQSPLLPASVAVDPRSPHARAVGILLLLLGAGVVYATTRQQPVIGPEGIPGGLGRWVSPRWGSPPSLRG